MVTSTPADSSLIEAVANRLNTYLSDSDEAWKSIIAAYIFDSALLPEKFKPNSDID